MLRFRAAGLRGQTEDRLLLSFLAIDTDRNEGVVRTVAQMISLFNVEQFRNGRTMVESALFWVPRALWPDKPPLMGWWLPRELMGSSGFGAGHSVSTGYVGEGYADFGLAGAYLWAMLIGVVVGFLARFTVAAASRSAGWSVLGALAYPAIFFAVRSPVTTAIVMSGTVLWTVLWARRGSGESSGEATVSGATGRRGVGGLRGATGLRGVGGLRGATGLRGVGGLRGPAGGRSRVVNQRRRD
jgi:hypothetical protein